MNALRWFDRVYVVHLPHPQRQRAMQAQLDALGVWEPTWLHAAPPPAGFSISNMRRNPPAEFGANLSHIRAVVQAIADRAERPLFLEDDVFFDVEAGPRLESACRALPAEWDVLYLGGHPRSQAELFTEHLAKVGTFSFAEAYSVRGPSLVELFAYWCNRISQPHAMYDFVLGEFAARHNGFAVYPVVTHQPVNYSQIGNKVDDKRALVEKGWRQNLSIR